MLFHCASHPHVGLAVGQPGSSPLPVALLSTPHCGILCSLQLPTSKHPCMWTSVSGGHLSSPHLLPMSWKQRGCSIGVVVGLNCLACDSLPSQGLSPRTVAGEDPRHRERASSACATAVFSHGSGRQIQHQAQLAGGPCRAGGGAVPEQLRGLPGVRFPRAAGQTLRIIAPVPAGLAVAPPAPLHQMGAEELPGSP